MSKTVFRADNAVFEMLVSRQAKLVYLYLCRCADQNGYSFPSMANISWAVSMSESSVQKALNELKILKAILVDRRLRANGSQTSNAYTVAVVKTKWFTAPDALFNQRVSATAKLLYLYLCRMAGKDASSYPSRKKMAAMCSCSLTSLARAMRELAEANLIEKNPRYRENGGQSSNLYIVAQPEAQPGQTKLRFIEGGKTEKNVEKSGNSLARQHLFVCWLGGVAKCVPLEGRPTWGTILNREKNNKVLSNLVPESRPP